MTDRKKFRTRARKKIYRENKIFSGNNKVASLSARTGGTPV